MLHRETGQRRVHVFLGIAFLVAGFFFFGIGAQFMVNVIGFAYPAYASFKAIESSDKRDDMQWCVLRRAGWKWCPGRFHDVRAGAEHIRAWRPRERDVGGVWSARGVGVRRWNGVRRYNDDERH